MNQNAKINYQKQLDDIIKKLDTKQQKPTLLLHACCAPCSSYVLEYLSVYFNITIYYYNPNIHPAEEYKRRLNEIKVFLKSFPPAIKNSVQFVEEKYNTQDFFYSTNCEKEIELQKEEERGERCRRCYLFRMKKAYEYAFTNGFNYFTTTLSISPHKDEQKINLIGKELESSGTTRFLPADFKKKNGYLRSLELSKEYSLYRQDYCGCVYSKQNMNK